MNQQITAEPTKEDLPDRPELLIQLTELKEQNQGMKVLMNELIPERESLIIVRNEKDKQLANMVKDLEQLAIQIDKLQNVLAATEQERRNLMRMLQERDAELARGKKPVIFKNMAGENDCERKLTLLKSENERLE